MHKKQADDDVLLKVEISVTKKAVDAVGKSFSAAVNFLPNLVIEGERNAERAVKNMQQDLGNAWKKARADWNHGLLTAERGVRDASVHTYKTINSGAEHVQRDATMVVSSTQHAVETGVKMYSADLVKRFIKLRNLRRKQCMMPRNKHHGNCILGQPQLIQIGLSLSRKQSPRTYSVY